MPSSPPPSPLDGLMDLVRRHRRVALVGPTGSGLTSRLIAHHRALLDDGVPATTILALSGPGDLERWRSADASGPAIAAGTFQGWVHQELETFWPLVEATGSLPPAGPRRHGRLMDFATPALARHRMASATEALREAASWEGRLRARPASQISQLLDALGLAVDHQISLEEAAERLAAAWVGGDGVKACRAQVAEALNLYRDWALRHRVLDAALQREVYVRYLWPLPGYQTILADRVRHMVVDEWTMTSSLAQTVLGKLAEQADTVVVASASDRAFAQADGAYPPGAYRLTADWLTVELEETAAPAPLVELGTALTGSSRGGVDPEDRLVSRVDFATRPAMLHAAVQDLRGLLAVGISPSAIALVLPTADRFGLTWLRAELQRQDIPYRLMVPAFPLTESLGVQVLCTLVRRLYTRDWRSASAQQVQAVVETLLGLDPLSALSVARGLITEPVSEPPGLELRPPHVQAAWGRLTGILDRYRATGPWQMDQALRMVFQELWAPSRNEQDVESIAQLIALAEEFQVCAAGPEGWSPEEAGWQFLHFLDQDAVLERPGADQGVLIAPGYAYARSGPPVDFQFWLDLGSAAWQWPLRRELSDPTVLSADWTGELDTPEAEELQTELRLSLAWRTMLLKARKAVRWYASDLDEEGREQTGGMRSVWERLFESRYAGLEVSP